MESLEQTQRKKTARRLAMMVKVVFRLSSIYGLDIKETARDFGVSVRTIYRYVETAREAGVPVELDKTRGVYYAQRGWKPGMLEVRGPMGDE